MPRQAPFPARMNEIIGEAPAAFIPVSKASRRPARASPAATPRNDERATVALAQSRWNRASNAASFAPQRSRQIDSPTDQAKKASRQVGTIWKTMEPTA